MKAPSHGDRTGPALTRRDFLRLAGGAAAATISLPAALAEAASGDRPPNFVIIFTDDQGYQDLGCFGSPKIKTPNIDRMAAEGMKFTDFYAAASVCTPSRAALMTGCYPPRVGLPDVLFPNAKVGINPDEITLAELLKSRGYATACVGKWHLGDADAFLPTRHGFDSYFGIPYSNDMSLKRDGASGPPLMRNEEIIEHPADQATLTERYTEEAVKFITANQNRPFFLYLPHTMPHLPLHVSERFAGKSAGGLYGDVIECIDWSTGQIVETIKRLGLEKNTIVVFTSDNGPWLGRKKGDNVGCALPLRDGKFSAYEGGMREPCVMWGPGRIPAGKVCSEMALSMDLYPTFARLAGVAIPADRVIDGKDIRALMSGEPDARTPHDAFFYYKGNNLAAVRSGKWKLHLKAKTELYDLSADVGEQTNVAAEHPDDVDRLTKMANQFDAQLKKDARPVGRVG